MQPRNMSSLARLVTTVVDVGPPADWVKINVRETVSSFQNVLTEILIYPRDSFSELYPIVTLSSTERLF